MLAFDEAGGGTYILRVYVGSKIRVQLWGKGNSKKGVSIWGKRPAGNKTRMARDSGSDVVGEGNVYLNGREEEEGDKQVSE